MKIEIDVDEAYSDTAIVIHTPRLTPDTEKLISLIRMLNMQIAVKKDNIIMTGMVREVAAI